MSVLEDGLFASIRKKHIFLNDSSFVSITCPKFHWTREQEYMNWFCHKEGVVGGPPYVIVDGSQNTAWTTIDHAYPELNYIIFDFRKTRVYVESFGLQTLCCPPKAVVLEGSNDYGKTWHQVANVPTPYNEFSIQKTKCTDPNFYSMYKIYQIGQCTMNGNSQYRFHIANLEFYGTISDESCIRNQRIQHSKMLYFLIFFCLN